MILTSTVPIQSATYPVKMPLGYATQSTRCNQSTASSEIDICQDSALFSNDIAMLYGGSGESHSHIRTECTRNSATVQIQNDRDRGGTDAQVPMYPMPTQRAGFKVILANTQVALRADF